MPHDHSAVFIRPAQAEDADAVAGLHAASWRAHYRGSLSDAYLDGPIVEERRTVWRQRLDHPRDGQIVLLAERDGVLLGFVCVFLDHDRDFGSLVDNLHVSAAWKAGGLGRRLMHEAAEAAAQALPRRPIHLFVLEANHAARGFYDRIGGVVVEQGRKTEPDGSDVAVLRYSWPTPAALLAGTAPT